MNARVERIAAVAAEFDRSWSRLLVAPGWWPARWQVECARLLREAADPAEVVTSPDFLDVLGRSLRQWRAFRGVPFDGGRLTEAMRRVAPLLGEWRTRSLLNAAPTVGEPLMELFEAVRDVKPTTRKWVATSKLLHHLLPDLVVPMDNEVVAPFFGRAALSAAFDRSFLIEAYAAFVDLATGPHGIGARRIRTAARAVPYPVAGADRRDCRIGVARVVDFAIAGFVLENGRTALRTLER